MQIDRYNHLQFPRNNPPPSGGNESSPAALPPGLDKAQGRAPLVPAERPSARTDSVVLNIQWPDDASAGKKTDTDAALYSPPWQDSARDGAQADAASQAADHQRAVERNAGWFTQITLTKDGVLVAKPQPSGEPKPPDFVALAVSAMREFSDEAERQKVRTSDDTASGAAPHWGKLKGLQQLAAKFNVFA